MIIGIDAREIQGGITTGMGRALTVFLACFAKQLDDHTCILFSSKPIPVECIPQSPRIKTVVKIEIMRVYWDQWVLHRLIKQNNISVFYSPYYKIPLLSRVPCISAIFDLMYIYCPCYAKTISPLARLYLKSVGRLMAHRADNIFTCSEYSKSEIMRFYGVKAEKISVIYLGLDPAYKPVRETTLLHSTLKKFNIESEYILYSGNVKLHKNMDVLCAAFALLRVMHPQLKLVLTGAPVVTLTHLQEAIDRNNIHDSVILTGKTSLDDQVILYSAAKLFVMPSLYEGFGYPPLEAMACGTPVVSSLATSLGEICGDACLAIDPYNPQDIADTCLSILSNPELASSLAQKGLVQAAKFSSTAYCHSLYTLILGIADKQNLPVI